MRELFLWLREAITSIPPPFDWEFVEVRPRQASVLVCVVLARTSEGLVRPRVLEGARCRCCGIEWSCRIDYSENLHSVEGGDVEQVSRTSKQLSHICDCSSFSLTCVLYLAFSYCTYLLHAWYFLMLN